MGFLQDLAIQYSIPLWLIFVAVAWSLIWKGLALWKSARRSSMTWFIILLVVNTLGILEILYIFLFSEIKLDDKKKTKRKRKKRKRKR